MVLPITAYGDPVLKQMGEEITQEHPGLEELIDNMFETMYNAHGVGLAAPQIGKSLRLFIIDADPFSEDEPELKDFKEVFINPVITNEEGEEWPFNEGCLSIPDIREDVTRKAVINIEYYNRNFEKQTKSFEGLAARIIQHEYDHIEGVLFTDLLTPLRRKLISKRLDNIRLGKISPEYRMKFYKTRKRK